MRASKFRKPRWWGPVVTDGILALLVAPLGVVPALLEASAWRVPLAVVIAVAQAAPLALRRVRPLAVLVAVTAATLALLPLAGTYLPVAALIAVYTVAATQERPLALRAGLAATLVLAVPAWLGEDANLSVLFFHAILMAVAWTSGAYLGELRARATRAEREREAEARRAVAEEQARIARELHDVIAHNLSVMVVQAAAAGDVFESSPGRAREALSNIESTGRQALDELRRVLAAVHPGPDGGGDAARPLAPQPGLARLDGLVDRVRSAGLAVELRIEGTPCPLPSGVELSAYRIVQEALTNTLKHAHANRAGVLVRYGESEVALRVRDDGRGPGAAGDGRSGRGIIGMRERAALYGGSLDTGPLPGGGFQVTARFPVGTER